jgi:hypothetical protein
MQRVSETDADDTLLTVDVRTIAGQQDLSRQAIERGTGIDTIRRCRSNSFMAHHS